jgi:hypothetical protein
MVLPPIDNSIEDKLIVLRTQQFPMPMPTATTADRTAFWAQLVSEIPAFLHFLSTFSIPAALSSERYGVTHFHHNDILREIDALSPEYRLMMIIDKELFSALIPATWTGTAEELETRLTNEGGFQYESRKLLSWANAAGTYLGRLAHKYPERFHQIRTTSRRRWTITPPADEPAPADAATPTQ